MTFSQKQTSAFQEMIFEWWSTHRRDLPWRHTHDPYHILVSEVMLQQTQVLRVIPKYAEFLQGFPSVEALSNASPASVLRVWKGMGYNRRALYLKRAAQSILKLHKGVFPESEEELRKLPGLGIYTARAVLVFAYKKEVGLVDTNIRQILTHFVFGDVPQSESIIQETADMLVPKGKSWEWHQALMDFGALALPKFRITSNRLPITKVRIPFKETSRFFRGRMMDRLRVSRMKEKDLVLHMMGTYEKHEDIVRKILSGLIKEGLIQKKGVFVQLPE